MAVAVEKGRGAIPDAGPAPTPLPESPARQRPRPQRRPRVAGGVVMIALIAVLLAGVVFMNLAVLRSNIELDRLGSNRTRLQADIAELSSELSSAQAAARIQAQARTELHLVPAPASDTVFVDLPAK